MNDVKLNFSGDFKAFAKQLRAMADAVDPPDKAAREDAATKFWYFGYPFRITVPDEWECKRLEGESLSDVYWVLSHKDIAHGLCIHLSVRK